MHGDEWRYVATRGDRSRCGARRDLDRDAHVGIRTFQVQARAARVTKKRHHKKERSKERTCAARGQWVSSPGLAPRACVGCSPSLTPMRGDGWRCVAMGGDAWRSDALCAGPRLWLKTAIRRYVAIRGDGWRCVAMSRAVCPLRVYKSPARGLSHAAPSVGARKR